MNFVRSRTAQMSFLMYVVFCAISSKADDSLPEWQGYDDLNEVLARFCKDGDVPRDDDFDPPDESTAQFGIPPEGYDKLRLFVLYGTLDNAKKAFAADRFDKEDMAASLSDHRERVRHTKFRIPLKYVWCDGPETGPNQIKLHVPMPCRCVVAQPSLPVKACDVFTGWWWWLDSETTSLKKCFNGTDASERRERGQELYAPEDIYQTRVMITINASRDVLKLIARNPDECTLNVGISGLRIERPSTVGFFRLAVVEKFGDSTDSVRGGFASGLNGPKDTPNYFVTQVAGNDAASSPPEVVVCDLERVEIAHATAGSRNVLYKWAHRDRR